MRTRIIPVVIAALLIIQVFNPKAGQARQLDPGAPAIFLKAATFVPLNGELPAIASGLALSQTSPGQHGYYLVQFTGPVEQAWKDQLAVLGAELLDYIPDF